MGDRVRQWALRHLNPLDTSYSLGRFGSDYGGWVIPLEILKPTSVCYCAGVGEDASFDLELIQMYRCEVFAFDPTPRAIKYAEDCAAKESNFRFYPFGLWDKDTELRFYVPENPAFVSHSAVNLRQTKDYFVAPVRTIPTIMHELQHRGLDLLKMDIEGAEHQVIEHMFRESVFPRIFCVEFDQPYPFWRINARIKAIKDQGYMPVSIDRWNWTFVREHPLQS